jgi:hypothetical protein
VLLRNDRVSLLLFRLESPTSRDGSMRSATADTSVRDGASAPLRKRSAGCPQNIQASPSDSRAGSPPLALILQALARKYTHNSKVLCPTSSLHSCATETPCPSRPEIETSSPTNTGERALLCEPMPLS